jgi:hypothetical protein
MNETLDSALAIFEVSSETISSAVNEKFGSTVGRFQIGSGTISPAVSVGSWPVAPAEWPSAKPVTLDAATSRIAPVASPSRRGRRPKSGAPMRVAGLGVGAGCIGAGGLPN